MGHHFNGRSAEQQRRLAKRAQKVDANHFFNLLTDPRMLGMVEAQLPEHRERQFPPTVTLAMFLGQIMSADGSCQNAVNEAIVARLLAGMDPGSVNTSGYCQARQRFPLSNKIDLTGLIRLYAKLFISVYWTAHTMFT